MSRDIAEVLLNHVTGGGKNELDEIYDRYDRISEKTDALKKYEAHIKKVIAAPH